MKRNKQLDILLTLDQTTRDRIDELRYRDQLINFSALFRQLVKQQWVQMKQEQNDFKQWA